MGKYTNTQTLNESNKNIQVAEIRCNQKRMYGSQIHGLPLNGRASGTKIVPLSAIRGQRKNEQHNTYFCFRSETNTLNNLSEYCSSVVLLLSSLYLSGPKYYVYI